MPNILIVAGEPSGDWYAGELATRLIASGASVTGVGQSHLAASGAEMLARSEEISVVGVSEVISRLPRIFAVLSTIKRHIAANRPDLVILIDFPDFNFRIGKFIKNKWRKWGHRKCRKWGHPSLVAGMSPFSVSVFSGVKVLYYVSPQVWAWRKGRKKTIASFSDAMICLFPFEKDIYRSVGLPTEYFGHPLVNRLAPKIDASRALPKDTIAILPGSRPSEVRRHLPTMIEAARIMMRRDPTQRFTFVRSKAVAPGFIDSLVDISTVPGITMTEDYYGTLARARAAMVASGTSTLETGLFGVPMVIIYRLSFASFLLAKMLVDVPFIGMANIVLGDAVAVELIQNDFTPDRLAAELSIISYDGPARDTAIEKLGRLRAMLTGDDPLGSASRYALSLCGNGP